MTTILSVSIGGSVVECSPATRAARVRFPAYATFVLQEIKENYKVFFISVERIILLAYANKKF